MINQHQTRADFRMCNCQELTQALCWQTNNIYSLMHLFGVIYSLCPWSRRHTQYTVWQNAKQLSETAGETPQLSTHIYMRMFSLIITLLAFQMGELTISCQECKHSSYQSVMTQMILSWSLPFWQGNGKFISTAVGWKTFHGFKNQKTTTVGDRRMDELVNISIQS